MALFFWRPDPHLGPVPAWIGYLLAFAVLAVIAPLFAWLGRRHGRTLRGGAGLALMMLGLGAMFDPPKQAMIEAIQGEEEPPQESGEPKDDEPDGG